MSCSRVLYGLVAALFGYVTAAVAAFVYLPWWQAALLLAAVQLALVLLARFWLRRAAARLLERLRNLSPAPTDPLASAEADVHAVRRLADGPDRLVEVELTLFPAGSSAGPTAEWDVAVLTGIAHGGDEAMTQLPLGDLRLRTDTGWRQPVGPLVGPQRLRFTLSVPSWTRTLTVCRRVPGGLAKVADLPLDRTALPPMVGS